MKQWLLGLVILGSAVPSVAAQTGAALPVGFEAVLGAAQLAESFSDDCCGPTRNATGSSVSVRVRAPAARLLRWGLDAGATFADHRTMKWGLAVLSVASQGRVAPWGQIGGGLVTQPGECPADGPNYGPGCQTDFRLGATAAGGALWTVSRHFAIGVEAALVRSATLNSRRFTTQRIGLTLRMQ